MATTIIGRMMLERFSKPICSKRTKKAVRIRVELMELLEKMNNEEILEFNSNLHIQYRIK